MKRVLPKYGNGTEPEPVKAAKSAISFANLYYNSPGFNERFQRVTSDKNGFLNSQYNPTASYWSDEDVWDNRTKMSWKVRRTPIKIGKMIPIPESNAYYNPDTGNVKWGDSGTLQLGLGGWNEIMAHEIGHALDHAIKVDNTHLGQELHLMAGPYGYTYSNIHPIFRKSKSYQKVKSIMDDKESRLYDKYPDTSTGGFNMSEIVHDARPEESYADLFSMRKIMYDQGIFDSTKSGQKFTKQHLNKFKEKNKSRLFDNFSDDDIIWMMNNVANVNSKKLSPLQRQV